MNPDRENLRVDMYTDVDFAGLYTTEYKMDPMIVKSRSRLLTFENVPIPWSSKLQSEIDFPSLEAEHIALSQGIRDLVSARRLMAEFRKRMN